jgi:hypothetical protein
VYRDRVDKEEGHYMSSDDGIECPKRGGLEDLTRLSKSRRVKVSARRAPFKMDQPHKLRIYHILTKWEMPHCNNGAFK